MKIYITGSSASGKTTYATALSKKLNLPLYKTDDFYNTSKKRMFTIDEIKKVVPISEDWIIEGAYYIPDYIHAADKIIFLKVSAWTVFKRIWKRWLSDEETREKFGFLCTVRLCYTTLRDLKASENIDTSIEQQKHYKNGDRYRFVMRYGKNVEEVWN